VFGTNYPAASPEPEGVLADASETADADAEADVESTGDPVGDDLRAARDRLRRRGVAVRRRELDEALCRLEAHGELTDDQRRAVRALADGIVDGVLAPPRAALEGDGPVDERRAARTVTRLFDPEE
jgi:glutamyl-tRNA reductase